MLPTLNKNRRVRKKGKLRYSTKNYSNPFFQKKSKRPKVKARDLSLKIKLISLSIVLLFIGTVWTLFYSSVFEIKIVTVKGGDRIEGTALEKLVYQQIENNYLVVMPQKNIFLFNKKKLLRNLETKYSFDLLKITKRLPGTLSVEYDEKDYSLIWQEDSRYYYADKEGYIIEEANLLEVQAKEYPLIENQSLQKIIAKRTTVEKRYLDYATLLFKKLRTGESGYKVERLLIDNDINTIKVQLSEGPAVYFNIAGDIDRQIDKLTVIKNQKLKENFSTKSYIDVRYGDSVYYR